MTAPHNHSHSHHGHHQHGGNNKRALWLGFLLIFSYMFVEIIGAVLTNSLALLSDAGHMFSDAVALGLSLLALHFGSLAANNKKTYGYKRLEILAALLNGLALLLIAIGISYEAYQRIMQPVEILGVGMMSVAVVGLIINLVVAAILLKADVENNLNMRSAFLHVLSDLLGSLGVIIAGVLIFMFDWQLADPIVSVVVAGLILISGYRVLQETVHILMEGAPAHIDMGAIERYFLAQDGVVALYDLHLWTITSEFPALSAHLQVNDLVNRDELLDNLLNFLAQQHHIKHATIQMEGLNNQQHQHC